MSLFGRGNKEEGKLSCINTKENGKIWGETLKNIEYLKKIGKEICTCRMTIL